MNKKVIRIIAIVLAVLMVIGVFIGAVVSTMAAQDGMLMMPNMGDSSKTGPIVICVVAVLVVAACIIIPKVAKKKDDGDE